MNVQIDTTQHGFTIIELLVVVALVALLLVGTTNLFLSTIRGGGKASLLAELKDQGDFALTTMERIIREGHDIGNCVGNSFQVTVYYVDGSMMYVRKSGTVFQRSDDGSTWLNISSDNVSVVSPQPFKCIDNQDGFSPDVVSIGFVLRDIKTGTEESFVSTVALRNVSTD